MLKQLDQSLLLLTSILLGLGLVMLASSSIALSENQTGFAFYYFERQLIYVGLGFILGAMIMRAPMLFWFNASRLLLLLALAMLTLVLVPGIGHEVNGAQRWIRLGPVNIQAAEIAKVALIIYFAGYLTRHHQAVTQSGLGFIKAMAVVVLVCGLLLLQPDFGTAVVILATVLGVLFLAGVQLRYFILMVLGAGAAMSALAISAPYRWQRITSFLNPWADQFDSGYQLTQALIAFGRGEWLGVGLGSGIQKLFYLPEAHTDFIFAVLSEELGLLGALTVLILYGLLVWRGMRIGHLAWQAKQSFNAYCAYGISLCLGLQVMVSMGVNTGLLPTKGLTLPLMSYGGSSLLMTLVSIAFLLRIAQEAQANLARPRWQRG